MECPLDGGLVEYQLHLLLTGSAANATMQEKLPGSSKWDQFFFIKLLFSNQHLYWFNSFIS